jgi:hypothetical protein
MIYLEYGTHETRINIVAATCGKADNDANGLAFINPQRFLVKAGVAAAARNRLWLSEQHGEKKQHYWDRTILLINTS